MKKNELEIIREIRSRFFFDSNLGIGIGDDSAVLNFKKPVLLTTDMMVEGVHFDLSYSSFYHIGFKIVSVNVSDIYAMGGDFKFFMLSAGVPEYISDDDLKEIFDGITDALTYYGGFLVGGDLSRSEKVVLSGVAVGESDKPVLRKGAEPGDGIFITAPTGLSSAGFNLLKIFNAENNFVIRNLKDFKDFGVFNEKFGFAIDEILDRHLLPKARKPDKFRDFAKAMIDISDGLLIDLYRLCEESDVGAEIYLEQIPIHPGVSKTAEYLNMDPMRLILSGGEDYELLVISNIETPSEFGLIQIGKIIKERVIQIVKDSNVEVYTKPEGWQHF